MSGDGDTNSLGASAAVDAMDLGDPNMSDPMDLISQAHALDEADAQRGDLNSINPVVP